MPELPEMQALAERLDERFTGRSCTGVDLLGFAALKTVVPPLDSVSGQTLRTVTRRGKYLVLDWDDVRMLLHLSQAGRLLVEDPAKRTRPKAAVLRIRFDDGSAVLVREYGTERKAACWVLEPDDDGPLAGLGPEPHSEEFVALVRTSEDARRVHTILRDQHTVAGLGRGYTDDALHRARLSPFATLAKLTHDERERLLEAIRSTLDDALEGERTRTGGLEAAKLGDRFIAHHHAGAPCPACGDTFRLISYESHEVTYCPRCQTGGKVLADRRMSRLVK